LREAISALKLAGQLEKWLPGAISEAELF